MRLALDAASRPGRIECGTNLLVSMSFSMAQKGNWWILMKMKLDLEYLKHSETIFNMCALSCPRFSGASFGDGMKRSFNMVSPGHLLDIYLFFFRQGDHFVKHIKHYHWPINQFSTTNFMPFWFGKWVGWTFQMTFPAQPRWYHQDVSWMVCVISCGEKTVQFAKEYDLFMPQQ